MKRIFLFTLILKFFSFYKIATLIHNLILQKGTLLKNVDS